MHPYGHLQGDFLVVAVHRLLLVDLERVFCLTPGARTWLSLRSASANTERAKHRLASLCITQAVNGCVVDGMIGRWVRTSKDTYVLY